MRQFLIILRNYLFRFSKEPLGLMVYLALPLGIILVNVLIFSANADAIIVDGYDVAASQISTIMMVMFQFFGSGYIIDAIYSDFRSDMRWRLYSTPASQNKFFFTAAAASWILTALQGFIIVGITTLFFNAYWGHPGIMILTVVLLSAVSQVISVILTLLTDKKRTTEAISMIIIFGMNIVGGMFMIQIPGEAGEFLARLYLPMRLGFNAIIHSGFMGSGVSQSLYYLGILAIWFVLLAVFAVIIGRRRKI